MFSCAICAASFVNIAELADVMILARAQHGARQCEACSSV